MDWKHDDKNPCGPRQWKALRLAMSEFRGLNAEMREFKGRVDATPREFFRTRLMFGAYGIIHGRMQAREERIGKAYEWTITKANVRAITGAYEAARQEMNDEVPIREPAVVAAVSSNVGGFGERRHIIIGRSGIAFECDRVDRPGQTDMRTGTRINLILDHHLNIVGAEGNKLAGFEHTQRKTVDAPQPVVDETFALPVPARTEAAA